jgi:uncharacterized protein YlaI
MKFVLVTGPAITVECLICQKSTIAGDQPYKSASKQEEAMPETVYADTSVNSNPFKSYYCQDCAAKLAVEDPARSVNQFFSDTSGKEIEPEHLPE